MTVLFIGGPLDGELREVPSYIDIPGPWQGILTQMETYHIANGIARHESISEEEVAQRVAAWKALEGEI